MAVPAFSAWFHSRAPTFQALLKPSSVRVISRGTQTWLFSLSRISSSKERNCSSASSIVKPESKAIKIWPGIVIKAVFIPIASKSEHTRIEISSQSPPRYISVW